jgi:hypothetical protein
MTRSHGYDKVQRHWIERLDASGEREVFNALQIVPPSH